MKCGSVRQAACGRVSHTYYNIWLVNHSIKTPLGTFPTFSAISRSIVGLPFADKSTVEESFQGPKLLTGQHLSFTTFCTVCASCCIFLWSKSKGSVLKTEATDTFTPRERIDSLAH